MEIFSLSYHDELGQNGNIFFLLFWWTWMDLSKTLISQTKWFHVKRLSSDIGSSIIFPFFWFLFVPHQEPINTKIVGWELTMLEILFLHHFWLLCKFCHSLWFFFNFPQFASLFHQVFSPTSLHYLFLRPKLSASWWWRWQC